MRPESLAESSVNPGATKDYPYSAHLDPTEAIERAKAGQIAISVSSEADSAWCIAIADYPQPEVHHRPSPYLAQRPCLATVAYELTLILRWRNVSKDLHYEVWPGSKTLAVCLMIDRSSGTLLFVVPVELVPGLLLLLPLQWQPCCLEALSFEKDSSSVTMPAFVEHDAPRNVVATRVETAKSARSKRNLA